MCVGSELDLCSRKQIPAREPPLEQCIWIVPEFDYAVEEFKSRSTNTTCLYFTSRSASRNEDKESKYKFTYENGEYKMIYNDAESTRDETRHT